MKRLFFTILFVGCIFTSCEHKELCFDHGHVRVPVSVVFDWSHAPEAAPKSMSLFLYPKGGGAPLRYEFAGRDGGMASIPIGAYDAVCVNSDTETALFRNTDRMETFEIRTDETELLPGLGIRSDEAPRAEGTETERVFATPEPMWGARTDDVNLVLLELRAEPSDEEPQTIVLRPEEIVCHYSVEIRNVSNLQYVSAVSGSLSGMSGGVLLASNRPTPDRATLPFATAADSEGITGRWLTFGHCPDADDSGAGAADALKHNLVVYVLFHSGEKFYYTYDATEKIHAAADPRHLHIVLDEGLPLPEPDKVSGGFAPSVNDWQPIYIDIIM